MRQTKTLKIWVAMGLLTACNGGSGTEETGETEGDSSGILTLDDGRPTDDGEDGTSLDGDDSGGDSTGVEPPVCGESEFVLEAVPPNVVLVLDKSGSMVLNDWDHDNDEATAEILRWASLFSVVDVIVTNFDAAINFGAVLFPSTDAANTLSADACVVSSEPEVSVAPQNASSVLAGIPAAASDDEDIRGATPATAGLQVALDHLKGLDPTVPRFMILVTDGAANCGASADTSECPGSGCGLIEEYDSELPTFVASAFEDDGIPTFVVGIDIRDALLGTSPTDGAPEANTFQELNVVAEAGGRAKTGDEKFYNALNQIELEAALQEIAGQVVSCTIPLGEPPLNPNYVEIEIAGQPIDKVENCETENGWMFTNPDGPYDSIELCGTACDLLAEAGNLDAIYGCPPSG